MEEEQLLIDVPFQTVLCSLVTRCTTFDFSTSTRVFLHAHRTVVPFQVFGVFIIVLEAPLFRRTPRPTQAPSLVSYVDG